MDVINDIVGTMRASGAAGGRVLRGSGTWGLRFPAIDGAGFHVIRQGSGWLVTPHREPVPVRAGDIVFSPYGAEHGVCDTLRPVGTLPPPGTEEPGRDAPTEFELICGGYLLNRGRVHPYLRTLPETVVMTPDLERHPELGALVDLVAADVHAGQRAAAVVMPALVDLLLVHGLSWVREQRAHHDAPDVPDAAIAAVLRAVHAELHTPWTVGRLSAVAGMPRAAFSQRFGQIVGEPPMTYVINRRLSHAAMLLRTTREPLAAVARQIGYVSEFAFASAFRRRFGIAPGRYRQHAAADA
ncbi:AraC-like DNA-binding protein [Catenuloplanes nepalensis]|uniref:AraC-like DNA-binding protein n=1 Tax=Catenuloplanes nepalensis TaxID=587533 RepID=A0ABT9MQQ5_9ACTN|nr:AraC family transcriptional regulator [Catenuloplanes nepalensis]MDP9793754.1 AraC-like DNA-binding protein [Catenuloplanes nepalensis]